MARLRITFRYLSLVAEKSGGVVVSLPKEGHVARIKGLTAGSAALSGDVYISQDGHRRWGQEVDTSLDRLIDVEQISGTSMETKAGVTDGALHSAISTRIYLSGGSLKTVLPYAKTSFKDVRWEVARGKKRVVNQKITDSIVYELQMKSGVTYSVHANGKTYKVPPAGLAILIVNDDDVQAVPKGAQPLAPPYELDEFAALYRLFKGDWSKLPYPTAYKAPKIKSVPGPNRPMCSSLRISF